MEKLKIIDKGEIKTAKDGRKYTQITLQSPKSNKVCKRTLFKSHDNLFNELENIDHIIGEIVTVKVKPLFENDVDHLREHFDEKGHFMFKFSHLKKDEEKGIDIEKIIKTHGFERV